MGMLHRIWRQRRRLALGFVGVGLGTVAGGSLWLMGMFLGLFVVLVVWAPGQRAWVERLALLWPLVCLLQVPGLLVPSVLVLGSLALGGIARLLDARVPLRRYLGAQATVEIDCAPAALWDRLCPQPWMKSIDPLLARVEEAEGGLLRLGYLNGAEQLIEIMEISPPNHWQTRTVPQPGETQIAVTAQMLEPCAKGTRLTVIEALWATPVMTALTLWLDDYLADHLDRIAALVEGRPDPSIKGILAR